MSLDRTLFYRYVAQTTDSPIGLEVDHAQGIYMYTPEGKRYIDLISGVTVSNVGHCHPHVVEAVSRQAAKYMHLMVYGEYIQSPQVRYAQHLAQLLPDGMDNVYFVNSGSEAVEGALKLAKRYTGRDEIISMQNAYHGSTSGCLALMGNEAFRYAFRPLAPNVRAIRFNSIDDLQCITRRTACVILDPLQCENGLVEPVPGYFKAMRKKCDETGTLLVFDEVQTAFGRTGSMFYFQQCGIVPDIVVMAKALGGGMPLGAFAARPEVMTTFTHNPALGHITTFGGHPVSCAAGQAALEVLLGTAGASQKHDLATSGSLEGQRVVTECRQASKSSNETCANEYTPLWLDADRKGRRYVEALREHPQVKAIRHTGLFIAVDLADEPTYYRLLDRFMDNGLVTDSFLYKLSSFRIAPPLNITYDQVDESIALLLRSLDEI